MRPEPVRAPVDTVLEQLSELAQRAHQKRLEGLRAAARRHAYRINAQGQPRKPLGRPKLLDDNAIQTGNDLLKQGLTLSEIAPLLGVSRATLYRYLDKR